MNKIIFGALTMLLFSFAPATAQISFKVEGEVEGGDNMVIALVIPSQSEDTRLTCKIVNGKFSFEGKTPDEVLAKIMIEEDVVDRQTAYMFFPFILSKGTTKLRFNIQKTEGILRYRIENQEIIEGDVAKEFKYFSDRISSAVRGIRMKEGDKDFMDSIYKNIVPAKRKAFESVYLQIRDSIKSAYNKMKLLESVAFGPVYAKNAYFTPSAESFVVQQFKAMNREIKNFKEYDLIATKFYKSFESPALGFTDFTLIDINGQQKKLSKIISENEFTVLYFWWTHCSPCRAFNKSQPAYYADLRKNKIEFVSINTDNSKLKWENTSRTDSIQWINLYAGDNSTIIPLYKITEYPTKIIIDKNFRIIDFEFKSMNDLHKLIKE